MSDSKRKKKRSPRPFGHAQNKESASTSIRLELLYAFQKNVAGNGERLGADFVERVLGRVPVTVVQKVSDDIHRGNASLQEGIMVILGGCNLIQKNAGVAQLG